MTDITIQLEALKRIELRERQMRIKAAYREGLFDGMLRSIQTDDEISTLWNKSHAKADLDEDDTTLTL